MRAEYENVLDDHLGQIHFTYVNTWDELLPAHWHEHLEIIYVLGGEITASINDVSYELEKGDIFLVNSNDIHYTYTHEVLSFTDPAGSSGKNFCKVGGTEISGVYKVEIS